jgi:hypothetical protein
LTATIVARLLADALAERLAARPDGPVHVLNIGGGPAADSFNALVHLRREHPGLLTGRRVTIHVLDVDPAGPAFGARALAALQGEGGPLAGTDAALRHVAYDWTDAAQLRRILAGLDAGDGLVAASTEGALFDYASDGDIAANLTVLRDRTPPDFAIVGSVPQSARTLDPRLLATEELPGRPAVRYLGIDAFGPLARSAGWKVVKRLDSVAHHVMCLVKT